MVAYLKLPPINKNHSSSQQTLNSDKNYGSRTKASASSNKPVVIPKRKERRCRCTYELRPDSTKAADMEEVLNSSSHGMRDEERLEEKGENTFIIDSMAEVNRTSISPTLTPVSQYTSRSFPACSSHTSFRSESIKTGNPYTSKVTIISEVAPIRRKPPVSLDRLLDYDNTARKVILHCSKYEEIGNPHARRSKSLKRIPTPSKWNRLKSYANPDIPLSNSRDKKLNFMDKQINSIYNRYEKARFEKHLLPITKQSEQVASFSKKLALPKIYSSEEEAIGTHPHQIQDNYGAFPKVHRTIPTIPLSLPQHSSPIKLRPLIK